MVRALRLRPRRRGWLGSLQVLLPTPQTLPPAGRVHDRRIHIDKRLAKKGTRLQFSVGTDKGQGPRFLDSADIRHKLFDGDDAPFTLGQQGTVLLSSEGKEDK